MFSHTRIVTNLLLQKYLVWSMGLLILVLSSNFPAHATTTLYLQELIQQLGIRQQDLVKLEQGETVSFNVVESNEKELAVGVAIYLAAPPSEVLEFLENRGMASVDNEVISQTIIPPQVRPDSFIGFSFMGRNNEAINFQSATPGEQFNLSTQEFQTLKFIDTTQTDAASHTYRRILWQRWQHYLKNGLKGIATYDRGAGKIANPGEELLAATLSNKVLARHFPELHTAWLNYPAEFPDGVDERFLLINRQVENRPTAVLIHRVVLAVDTGGIILSRQFYVGHSYNSGQLTIGSLPYRGGSLVFYANRTFTDQITGFGSGVKRSIGREQMRRRMERHLRNLSNVLKQDNR